MDLSIIIVNWNSCDYLQRCIASIEANTHAVEFEVVVIDAGSFDGCDRMLRRSFPQVRFLQSPINCGFAAANNRAFRESVGERVLFLNPDTELVGPALETLCAALDSLPDAGLVGCRLLNADGTVQSSCVLATPTISNQFLDSEFLRARWPKSRLWGAAALYQEGNAAREVEAVSGACLLTRRETFEQVGGFSDDYFMYAEDLDLAYRLRRAGCKTYYVPAATVIHCGGSSAGHAGNSFTAAMMPEATWRFFRRNRGMAPALGYRAAMLASAVGRLAILEASRLLGPRLPTPSRDSSIQKWLTVLRWSLWRDETVKRFYARRVRTAQ